MSVGTAHAKVHAVQNVFLVPKLGIGGGAAVRATQAAVGVAAAFCGVAFVCTRTEIDASMAGGGALGPALEGCTGWARAWEGVLQCG